MTTNPPSARTSDMTEPTAPMTAEPSDPVERACAIALTVAGYSFVHESQAKSKTHELDFALNREPQPAVYIEVKKAHSWRIAEQMSRVKKRDRNSRR